MTEFQRGNSVSFRTCLRLLGLMASALIVVPLGRLFMREFQRWVASQGLDPLRHSRWRVTSEAVLALCQWRHWSFVVQGVPMGVVRARQVITTDASLSGWGGIHEGRIVNGRWGQHLTNLHMNYFEMLAVFLTLKHFLPFLKGHNFLVRTDNTTVVAYINRQGGLRSLPLHMLARKLILWSNANLLSPCDARTWCYEQGCGSAVQGQSPLQGVEIEQGSGRTDLGHIRQSDSGSVRVPRQCSVSSVFFPERSERASGDRCACAQMASHSPLRIPTDSIDIPNTLQSEGGGSQIDINSSEVAREVLASGDHTYAVRRPVVSPAAQRSFITSRGGDFSSSSRKPGTMGLACEWFNLNTTGLSDSVIRTIQNARASSTRSLYECKWGVFERWCATKHEIPVQWQ